MAKEKMATEIVTHNGVSIEVGEYNGHPLLVVAGPARKDGTHGKVMAGASKIRNILKHGTAVASDFYGARVAESFAMFPVECGTFLEVYGTKPDGEEVDKPAAPAPAPAPLSATPAYAPAAKAKARGASAKRFVPAVVAVASAPVATVPAPGAGVTAVAADDTAAKAAAIIARIRAGLPLA